MKDKFAAIMLTFAFQVAVSGAPPKVPAPSVLAKSAIVQMLSLTKQCGGIEEEVQEAIQPLLIQISYARDQDSDQVLIDLSSYRLVESNYEILLCALSNRFAESKTFVRKFAAATNDCKAGLNKPDVCLSEDERRQLQMEVKRVARRGPCKVEP